MITNQFAPNVEGSLKTTIMFKDWYGRNSETKKWVAIRRLRCCKCHAVHRELPDFIFPYKQYEADIIIGVLEG
ncbi:DUF6431 domain-containing protein, partial [Intestinimonas massiliensis]|nr:DUF6431 domain-containing protein [Intestinimonas massiliensis (ex Afouda et al. 2020)]